MHPRSSSAASEETEVARLTRERDEALQQQAATADVLKVISRSTFDLRRCSTRWSSRRHAYARPTGVKSSDRPGRTRATTRQQATVTRLSTLNYVRTLTFAPGRGGVIGRVLLEGKSVQIPDVLADPEYAYPEAARLGNFRTILGVPLLREGIPIGILVLQRAAVRPFTEKQIKLVETFADQAVIAIENTRLFEAEQQRTRELAESLEQQTATAEVLKVISRSPGDLQPVFDSHTGECAARICEANSANIYRWMAMPSGS